MPSVTEAIPHVPEDLIELLTERHRKHSLHTGSSEGCCSSCLSKKHDRAHFKVFSCPITLSDQNTIPLQSLTAGHGRLAPQGPGPGLAQRRTGRSTVTVALAWSVSWSGRGASLVSGPHPWSLIPSPSHVFSSESARGLSGHRQLELH